MKKKPQWIFLSTAFASKNIGSWGDKILQENGELKTKSLFVCLEHLQFSIEFANLNFIFKYRLNFSIFPSSSKKISSCLVKNTGVSSLFPDYTFDSGIFGNFPYLVDPKMVKTLFLSFFLKNIF